MADPARTDVDQAADTQYTRAVRKRLGELRRHPGHDGPTVCACTECVLHTLVETGLGQIEYDAAALTVERDARQHAEEALRGLGWDIGEASLCWCPDDWWGLDDVGAAKHDEDEHSPSCLAARAALAAAGGRTPEEGEP